MMRTARALLVGAAITFAAAALVHRGILGDGYRHRAAFIAESVIAAVLLAGLVVSWLAPHRTRQAGSGSQALALLGTGVGLVTIAVGVGPRTVPDVVSHIVVVVVLIGGLTYSVRARDEHSMG